MSKFSDIWWDYDNDDNVPFVLYQHAELDFYKASSLKQQSADRHFIPSLPDFSFQAYQILLLLLSIARLTEKQTIPMF